MKGDVAAAKPAHAVTVYMAGANRWTDFDAVPWAGRDPSRTFFLAGGGAANTRKGDGMLVAQAPVAPVADRFTYDPANPVIAHGIPHHASAHAGGQRLPQGPPRAP